MLVCVPSFVVCGQRASCERKAVSFVLSCRTHTSDSMCPCLIEYRSLAGNYGSYTNTPSRWPGNASLLSTLSMPWTVTRRTLLGVDEIMIALPGLSVYGSGLRRVMMFWAGSSWRSIAGEGRHFWF